MQDRPNATELLAAVRGFLESDVVPASSGRRRFHALVAANVLAIVERELVREEERVLDEWRSLARLLDVTVDPPPRLELLKAGVRELTEQLCERIRAGDADAGDFGERVRAHLRATVLEKLRIANPRYLGDS
ncbi:MAG TPA: DUF6285 domain-containing protein [Candidatus Limnocylindria bacterium]|nr:DUF6285 domain-containing protein [Candidatus Limnocylindria bacterium]